MMSELEQLPQRPASPRDPKRGLGRGLSALIPQSTVAAKISPTESLDPADANEVADLRYIPLIKIALNPFQPREDFPLDQLQELTDSIRHHGVLQPIVVRPKGKATFELVAGERRFRAATNAGLSEIPAIVRDIDDRSSLAIALIENIQRQELNPVESARAYQRLLSEFHLTQVELAQEVGKSQPAIANSLRLLLLPDPILASLANRAISEGHGKVLLSLENENDKLSLWTAVVKNSLNVRETERRAAAMKSSIPRGIKPATGSPAAPVYETVHLQDRLSLALGTKVKLRFTTEEKGTIEIQFYGLDQLDGLLQGLIADKEQAE
jgi:ParB family chromosome partitioning protein